MSGIRAVPQSLRAGLLLGFPVAVALTEVVLLAGLSGLLGARQAIGRARRRTAVEAGTAGRPRGG